MIRAEATARVVAAAQLVAGWHDHSCECPVCLATIALDACPPEDERRCGLHDRIEPPGLLCAECVEANAEDARMVMDLFSRAEADLHDARALAWAAGEHLYRERQWVLMYHGVYAWNLASMIRAGDWPTRDAEHAAWAGRYRAKDAPSGPEVVTGGEVDHGPTCVQCNQRKRKELSELHRLMLEQIPLPTGALVVPTEGPDAPQAAPAPAQRVAPAPEWATQENRDAARRLATYGTSDVWRADVMRRLAALEIAVMGHECAGPAELIDADRLAKLEAQMDHEQGHFDAIVQRAVRRLAEGQWHASNIAGNTETETKALLDDGGPDAPA